MKKFSLTLLFVTCLYVNSLFGASSMSAPVRDAIAECMFQEAESYFNKARALGENPKPVHVGAWANEQQDYSALKAMPKVERQKKQHDLYLKAINSLGGFYIIGQPELFSCRTSPEQPMTLKEKIVHNLYTIYKDSHQQLKVDLSSYSDFYKTAILFNYYKFHLLELSSLYDAFAAKITEISATIQ